MSIRSTATKTERLVITALMMSLILIGTIVIRIPIPMTQGYVHLGDAMIYIGVLLLGRKEGTAAAAIGSAMADVLGGFAMWAPWTLVIKGLMAFIAGTFIARSESPDSAAGQGAGQDDGRSKLSILTLAGMILGGIVMVAGYFAAEGIMYGNWPAAALGIPWNIGQFAVGIIVATSIHAAVSRMRSH